MDDLISRRAALDEFDGVKVDEETKYDIGYNDGIDFAISTLSVLPSAQPYKEPYIIKINKPIENDIKRKLRKIFQTQIGEEPVVLLPTDCEVIPQIIRCKECRHYEIFPNGANGKCKLNVDAEIGFYPWDFCSHAERGKDE